MFSMKNGNIIDGDINMITLLIEKGFIPVLFGDVALAVNRGIDILSGDQIISFIANKCLPKKVIFLMDVNGIFDKNPNEHKDAKLIKIIDKPIRYKSSLSKYDVTGGIDNKISQAFLIPCSSYFINGKVKMNLSKVISGENPGTLIKRGE